MPEPRSSTEDFGGEKIGRAIRGSRERIDGDFLRHERWRLWRYILIMAVLTVVLTVGLILLVGGGDPDA